VLTAAAAVALYSPWVEVEAIGEVSYPHIANTILHFDMYRAMRSADVGKYDIEDDDIADLGGVVKYVHTEIIEEHAMDPLRKERKYGIDVLTRRRFKIMNTDAVLASSMRSMGQFAAFVTYDWGQATALQEMPLFEKYGDFVGVQNGCGGPLLHCDIRYPSSEPYSWFSVGNWCPNLKWSEKGTKSNPNPSCLKGPKGEIVMGGLCPDGIDKENFDPTAEPTGEPGCIYTYGKAEVVRLDDVVGLTEEDCGGRKCDNWLDFRENCTKTSLRRKFSPDGTIIETDFCVEFDLHPMCDTCFSEPCQTLLKAGKEVYLGMPYWAGRCDGRANVRRAEQTAAAFGIGDGMAKHRMVDPEVLEKNGICPRSHMNSYSCTPDYIGEDGSHGPYCTRNYNGACQNCFVPGTTTGPVPNSHPYCPLDIFHLEPYHNRSSYPMPKCKSKEASDLCCLYSKTCKGTSDPETATLDDNGFKLVASRRNSVDMATYLKRALGVGAFEDEAHIQWASYFAWDNAPIAITLEEVKNDMGATAAFAKSVKIAPKALVPKSATPGCFDTEMTWSPLDMAGTSASQESSATACQKLCQNTKGCLHFSFWRPLPEFPQGQCHLHDIGAVPVPNSPGYTAGPHRCWDDLDTSNYIDVGHKTYVTRELGCLQWARSYDPSIASHILSSGDGDTVEQQLQKCAAWCAANKSCNKFSFFASTKMCILAGAAAVAAHNDGAISGPPSCSNKELSNAGYYRLYDETPKSSDDASDWNLGPHPFMNISVSMVLLIALLSVGFIALLRQRSKDDGESRMLPTPSTRSEHQPLVHDDTSEFERTVAEEPRQDTGNLECGLMCKGNPE